MDIEKIYDDTLLSELTKRLGRVPLPNEITNADRDNDLVNEVFWKLICNLANRVTALETKAKVKATTSLQANDVAAS